MAALHLTADARSPRRAREFTRQVLGNLGVDADFIEDAELIVTELVTNAVIHAGTDIILEIEAETDDAVHIRVTDYEQGTVAIREADPDAPTGRGLQIVDRLSDSWSVADRGGDGKVVEIILERGFSSPVENVG